MRLESAAAAKLVGPMVEDAPILETPDVFPRQPEQVVAGVMQVGAASGATLAQVVHTARPVPSRRRVASDQVEYVEIGKDLDAEDLVVSDSDTSHRTAEIIQVPFDVRQPQHRDVGHLEENVLTFKESFCR